MPKGRRIEELAGLTPEQDLAVVLKYMDVNPVMQLLEPDERSDWYERHLAHAKKLGTTVSEQLVITAEMADMLEGTRHTVILLGQLEEFVDGLVSPEA